MNAPLFWVRRLVLLEAFVATTACGSDPDSGGNGSGTGGTTSSNGSRCRLEITVSGAATFVSDLDDPMSCITAYTRSPGAYVGYGFQSSGDVGSITLRFPELEPGRLASSIELPVSVNHVDGTEFSPMGCVAAVTENTFSETTDAGDVYRVAGEGSCGAPGVVGGRSVSVGFFRFIAPIRWQN